MSSRDALLGMANTDEHWDDAQKSEIVARVVAGTLSIRNACARYGLSEDRIRDWVMVFRRSALQAFDEHLRETLVSQGLDADHLVPAAFTGTLEDIAISDLVQTMTMGRRDGVITVSHDGRESRLWIAAGAIVDAESGKLRGDRAAHRILALDRGNVVADFCSVSRDPPIQTTTLALLMDGARRKDECRVLKERLGDTLYYRRASRAAGASAAFSPAEAAVLCAFELPREVADVVGESDLGDLETLRIISELVQRECLSPAGPARSGSPTPPPRESFLIQASLRGVLPPAPLERGARPPSSRQFRTGLAAALCGLGIAGGFLLTRFVTSVNPEATALPPLDPVPPPRAEPSTASLPLAAERAAEPPAAPASDSERTSESPSEPEAPAIVRAGELPSLLPAPPARPAVEPAPTRANQAAQQRAPSTAPPSPGSEAPEQPRMRIIEEEEIPSMRVLE